MSIRIQNRLEQRIEKAIKQLPYETTKEDFVTSALNNYFVSLVKTKMLKQKV